jgi:cytosine/uracil/thiamine/allantoin permease
MLLLKVQTNYKKLCLEGKMSCVCSYLGPTSMLHYRSMKEGSLLCFVLMICPNHSVLGYAIRLIIRKFSMNTGARTWFRMFGIMVWTLLIIEPFFH